MIWEDVLKRYNYLNEKGAINAGADSAKLSGNTLTADFSNAEKAYRFSQEMEKAGFNVEFKEKDPYTRLVITR